MNDEKCIYCLMEQIIRLKNENRKLGSIIKYLTRELNHRHGYQSSVKYPSKQDALNVLIKNLSKMNINGRRILKLRDEINFIEFNIWIKTVW